MSDYEFRWYATIQHKTVYQARGPDRSEYLLCVSEDAMPEDSDKTGSSLIAPVVDFMHPGIALPEDLVSAFDEWRSINVLVDENVTLKPVEASPQDGNDPLGW